MTPVAKDILKGTLITLGLTLVAFSFLAPLPISYYRVKAGQKAGLTIALIAFIVITFMAKGLRFEMLFTYQYLIIGLLMGEAIARRYSINKTFLTTFAGAAILGGLWIFGTGINTGLAPAAVILRFFDTTVAGLMSFYQAANVNSETVALLQQVFENVRPVFAGIFTGVVMAIAIIIIWINFMLARWLFRRFGLAWPYGNFNEWYAPPNLVYAIILGVILVLFAPGTSVFYFLGLTLILVLGPVYCFQGLAVISYLMQKYNVSKPAKMIVYIVIAVWWLLLFGICAVGFFDVWVNFRKLGQTKTNIN